VLTLITLNELIVSLELKELILSTMFRFCDDFCAMLLETLSISMIAVRQQEMLYEGIFGDSLDLKAQAG